MTSLCVSIFVETESQTRRDVASAIEAGADLVELRFDILDNAPDAHRILTNLPGNFIVTWRGQAEGGFSDLPDLQRVHLLADLVKFKQVNFCDIELSALASADLAISKPIIASVHGFKSRPAKLYNLIDEMNHSRCFANKIAWTARSIRDNIEAFEILIQRQKPATALCMGEAGLISRILAKKFGGFLTYATLRKAQVTAPGQPTIDELKKLYRWDAINPKTKVFGVVGSPIAQSLSPTIHNAAFDATNFDGVYLPMLVEPGYESFKAYMASFVDFKPLDLCGLSITAPHKENALRYLKEVGGEIDPRAAQIGAVNTIAIGGEAQLRGFNTDHDALLDALCQTLNKSRDELSDLRFAIIGAGGTARTAVAALAQLGATIVIYNRTREKADTLAKEFDGRAGRVVAARLEKLCDSCCHVFINCTSVGMSPDVDQSPLGDRLPNFTSETLVFDTIYNPARTKLLHQAEAKGAKTLNGAEMFLRQAAAQFQTWTNASAPLDAMRRALNGHSTDVR